MEIGVKFLGLHGKTVLQSSPKQLKQTLTCLKKEIEISELQDTWTTQEKLYRSILSFYFSQPLACQINPLGRMFFVCAFYSFY